MLSYSLTLNIHFYLSRTKYIQYHPGGVPKLMMGAGKDCTSLFNKYHPWVNAVGMIGKCMVGTYHAGTVNGAIDEDEEEDSKA